MFRKFALFVILPITAIALFCFFFRPTITVSANNSSSMKTLGAVNQLSRLLQDYASRKETRGQYPQELFGLVANGIIPQKDFDKLTAKRRIGYFPPTGTDPSANHVILLAGAGDLVVYATISGETAVLPNNK